MAPKLPTIFEDNALEDQSDSQKTLTPFEFATSISSDSDVDGMPLPASERPSMTATPMMLAKEKAPPKAEVVDEGHPGHDKWSGPPDPDISQVAPATPPGQGCKLDFSIPAELDGSGYGPSNYGSSPSTVLNSNYHLEGQQLQFSILD